MLPQTMASWLMRAGHVALQVPHVSGVCFAIISSVYLVFVDQRKIIKGPPIGVGSTQIPCCAFIPCCASPSPEQPNPAPPPIWPALPPAHPRHLPCATGCAAAACSPSSSALRYRLRVAACTPSPSAHPLLAHQEA